MGKLPTIIAHDVMAYGIVQEGDKALEDMGMTTVAESIIEGSNVILRAANMRAKYMGTKVSVPKMLDA